MLTVADPQQGNGAGLRASTSFGILVLKDGVFYSFPVKFRPVQFF